MVFRIICVYLPKETIEEIRYDEKITAFLTDGPDDAGRDGPGR